MDIDKRKKSRQIAREYLGIEFSFSTHYWSSYNCIFKYLKQNAAHVDVQMILIMIDDEVGGKALLNKYIFGE